MLNLSELENLHPDIQTVHELVQILRARIDGKEIEIHILRNQAGRYFYELSHFYMGADNADPIVSTENIFSCVEEAAEGAVRSAVMFYRSTDEGGIWVKNSAFFH